MQYFLKARFGFDKKQFADLLLLITIVGSISQLFVLPRFASAIGECKLLSTGLFMEFINMAIVSISWAPWVSQSKLGTSFYVFSQYDLLLVFSSIFAGSLSHHCVCTWSLICDAIGLWYCLETSWTW
jgi:hypothetical protein